jgi:branched-chain amino acid transport system ATP-binding protein
VVAVTGAGEPLVDVRELSLRFGGVTAVDEVSFSVARGGITAVIGPNGAGKTSLFNCITGFYRPTAGSVLFKGRELVRLPRHRIPQLGIARTFQTPGVFEGSTVLVNLMLGRYLKSSTGLVAGMLKLPRAQRAEREQRRAAEDILELLSLSEYRDVPAKDLPYGLRKRLDFGRALAQEPELLLLDEPMAGMSREEKGEMAGLMDHARRALGATIVLVEHDMNVVMSTATHVVVLNFGRKIADGTSEDVQRSPAVIAAYLGTKASEESQQRAAAVGP